MSLREKKIQINQQKKFLIKQYNTGLKQILNMLKKYLSMRQINITMMKITEIPNLVEQNLQHFLYL